MHKPETALRTGAEQLPVWTLRSMRTVRKGKPKRESTGAGTVRDEASPSGGQSVNREVIPTPFLIRIGGKGRQSEY
jgi:hypothetical protein